MGTDISMYAERRERDGWHLCEPLLPNRFHDPSDPESEPALMPQAVYDTRNSSLFAILAGVRNLIFSETRYQTIAPPRGLPSDLSPELAPWAAYFDSGAFGHSWYLLAELQAFPWSKLTIKKRAMVSPAVAPLFAGGEGPFPYDRWPADEEVRFAEWSRDGVHVTWVETYAQSAGTEFLDGVLQRLATYGAPEDVRVVFWFDS
jgi:hypothetical protein